MIDSKLPLTLIGDESWQDEVYILGVAFEADNHGSLSEWTIFFGGFRVLFYCFLFKQPTTLFACYQSLPDVFQTRRICFLCAGVWHDGKLRL